MKKYCPKCETIKEKDLFYKNKSRADGLSTWCKTCHNAQSKEWASKNRDKRAEYFKTWYDLNRDTKLSSLREWHLKSKYGITIQDYIDLFNSQNGVCAICFKPGDRGNLDVDHCHKTGRVRVYFVVGATWQSENLKMIQIY